MAQRRRLGETLPLPGSLGSPKFDSPPDLSSLADDAPTAQVRNPLYAAQAFEHGTPEGETGPFTERRGPEHAATDVEVVTVHEQAQAGAQRKPWRAAEVWTRHHIYGLDSSFQCFEVLDRTTGRAVGKHPMIGARLGGGRARETNTARFSYPLPLPGMEAMFMQKTKHGYTSPVERMVLRMRVLHTRADDVQPTWEQIAMQGREPRSR